MKTVKKPGESPIRVKDAKATELTAVGYEYCPKSEFKALYVKNKEEKKEKKVSKKAK